MKDVLVLRTSQVSESKLMKFGDSMTSRYASGSWIVLVDGEIDSAWHYESDAKERASHLKEAR